MRSRSLRESPLTMDGLPRECKLISFNSFSSPSLILPITFTPTCVFLFMLFWLPSFYQFTNLLSSLFFVFSAWHCAPVFVVTLHLYITSQVGAYHNARIQCVRPASALTLWDERQTLWPLLTIIARHTLCVLASSATSERSFLKIGHIMSSRRRRLSDAHVQELSFISWNADLLKS